MFSKIFLKNRSPVRNVRDFIRLLYKFAILCWQDAIRIVAVAQSSYAISRSLEMALALAVLGTSIQSVDIPISVGIMAFIL